VRDWAESCDYAEVHLEREVLGNRGLADLDRPTHEDEVRAICAAIYARFAASAKHELVFTLEDDVLPPLDVYSRLQPLVAGRVISASAYYLGRLVGDPIAWQWGAEERPVPAQPAEGVGQVGGHGFGAAVFRRDIFKPERFHAGEPLHDFDCNFFHQLVVKEGYEAVVDWETLSRHYVREGAWAQSPSTALRLRLLKGAPAALSIAHLNAYDRHGGAERLATELITAQRRAGHASIAVVGHKSDPESLAVAFATDPDLSQREALQKGGWPDYEYRGSHRLMLHETVQQAEIIHAHNLYGGYFHPFSLIALSQEKPVVWSIHDMQALTGYCSHALDCPRWQHGCGECPDLTRPGPALPFDNTAALWRDKKLISDNSRLWIAGASEWMVGQLKRSLLSQHPIHLVPNGIDTGLFRPSPKEEVRRKLGLPADALIVASLARSGVLKHPWKGGPQARLALEALKARHEDLLFLNLGADKPEPESWMHCRAPATPEELREYLGAADFFLYPSIADTAPLAVLEAMACGLPVVGFQTGGIPDMVTAEVGLLVPQGDNAGLVAACLRLAGDGPLRREMGPAARARAVKHFDQSVMAAAYEKLYHEVVVAHAGEGLPRHTLVGDSASPQMTEALRHLQGEEMRLQAELRLHKAKHKHHKAKTQAEEEKVAALVQHSWTKLGLRWGRYRDPLRKWLKKKGSGN
jgi:glycosyltransferase involved in cell wall biosynthesis